MFIGLVVFVFDAPPNQNLSGLAQTKRMNHFNPVEEWLCVYLNRTLFSGVKCVLKGVLFTLKNVIYTPPRAKRRTARLYSLLELNLVRPM